MTGIMAEKVLKKTEKKLLDIRIRQCTYTIKKLSDQKDTLEKVLYENIPSVEKTQLEEFIACAYRKSFDATKTRHREKFDKLQQKTTDSGTGGQKDNSDYIEKR